MVAEKNWKQTKNEESEQTDCKQFNAHAIIDQNGWQRGMEEAALEKTKEMLIHVAYPEFILDSKQLDDFYSNFSVEETDSYSQVVEKMLRWESERNFKLLSEPVDRAENVVDATDSYLPLFYKRTSIILFRGKH
ncbi:hypothetical protein COOONC_22263 [Cooperia oncophora]